MSSRAKWVGALPAAVVDEQAYLVSRGVRPLALLGSVDLDTDLNDAFVRLNQLSTDAAIPFVLPRKDMPCAMLGFAAAQWVIDLLEWTYDNAPLRQRHCIVGLLLGYSSDAIAKHDAREFAGIPTAISTSR